MYSLLHRISSSMSQEKYSGTSGDSSSANQLEEWQKALQNTKIERNEMNKLVMNYLMIEGYKEAAEKFRVESGIEPSQPLTSLDERIKIREAVQNGDIDEAISLTNNVNPDILDCNPMLYFHLQQQKLIEFIRVKNIEKALEFSQNMMAILGSENEKYLNELEKTMALLAFENPESSPFSDLLSFEHKRNVANELNIAVLDAEHQETMPKLSNCLKLVLWSQNELDKKKVKYPKMTDLSTGKAQYSNSSSSDEKITSLSV